MDSGSRFLGIGALTRHREMRSPRVPWARSLGPAAGWLCVMVTLANRMTRSRRTWSAPRHGRKISVTRSNVSMLVVSGS